MAFIFWFSLFLVIYAYAGYFLLMIVLARVLGRKPARDDAVRSVTVIIAAYNEERHIKEKLENVLALEYPQDQLSVIVGSDASCDGTDDIVASFPDHRVSLVRVEGRRGKTAVQNECMRHAQGEIVVFTDSTTHLYPESLRALVSYFADPQVGCAGGRLIYKSDTQGQTETGGVAYWSYEAALKQRESDVNSLVGVSGCYYAVRRESYSAIDPGLISDFVIALDMVGAGHRVVYAADAVCEEETLVHSTDEFAMRVRVVLRSITALVARARILNPFRRPMFALQLWSHKVLRYSIWILLFVMLASSLTLAGWNIYGLAVAGQAVVYLAGMVGFVLSRRGVEAGVLALPYYFCLTNAAAVWALVRFLSGDRITVWSPKR